MSTVRTRLCVRVSSPDAARRALAAGADYVLAPLRRERPSIGVPDRLAEGRDGPETLLAVAVDESLPGEPLRVARLREVNDALEDLSGFAAVLLDPDRALLRTVSLEALARFQARCREAGLECWLGGALEAPDIPRLLVLGPDALVFDEEVDPAALRSLLIQDPPDETGATDRILVRDLVLPLTVGAYGFEQGRAQRVRFNVEADVLRPRRRPREMGDVYSYDLILDAARRLTERGHTALVETLAEELAEAVLADPRVRAVQIDVEKLDLGPGAVGIRISRTRDDLLID
ncbi:dihydroneopterin aldolase [Aureimonas jatrophae]|uniref:(5-formylfuran-3-yl)methyl phosphate synthase n=1 Tax=Aureimonas jatrophae TaxID=1166073 RepID=A0A1H0HP28_9HYPH|nr:dihydroneopterin aldolase [Aureimonas jatrophae]MBB3950694.1 dihydroneopterin aldolase [Aureimonas jatrophae]SDO20890.1 dihydroneopterin aldolase [Aureimonas jatrophae]